MWNFWGSDEYTYDYAEQQTDYEVEIDENDPKISILTQPETLATTLSSGNSVGESEETTKFRKVNEKSTSPPPEPASVVVDEGADNYFNSWFTFFRTKDASSDNSFHQDYDYYDDDLDNEKTVLNSGKRIDGKEEFAVTSLNDDLDGDDREMEDLVFESNALIMNSSQVDEDSGNVSFQFVTSLNDSPKQATDNNEDTADMTIKTSSSSERKTSAPVLSESIDVIDVMQDAIGNTDKNDVENNIHRSVVSVKDETKNMGRRPHGNRFFSYGYRKKRNVEISDKSLNSTDEDNESSTNFGIKTTPTWVSASVGFVDYWELDDSSESTPTMKKWSESAERRWWKLKIQKKYQRIQLDKEQNNSTRKVFLISWMGHFDHL